MKIVHGRSAELWPELMADMARYRHRVFVERLGWPLHSEDGLEFDEFDRPHTLYIVAQNDFNEVIGTARLLSTVRPYLLDKVFPQLLRGLPAPASPEIWELSRFAAVDFSVPGRSPSGQFSSAIAVELLQATLVCAASRGARRLITVSPLGIERLLRKLFSKVEMAVRALGFEHCAYGLRMPFPLSAPRIVLLNNYPSEWQARYLQKDYLAKDPTVLHGRRSQEPLVWRDAVFASTPDLWDDARSFGLCEGWAQSNLDAVGVGGMLTLSRSREPLSAAELASKEATMRWLVSLTHLSPSSIFVPRMVGAVQPALTAREIEVLKWTGDGKTSSEISTLLSISDHTVNFHVRNAVIKLQVANNTAAVVRAAMLGLLN